MADDEQQSNEDNQHENSLPGADEAFIANLMASVNGGNNLKTVVQAYTQEYENLDHTLDEIDSWMTKLEEQNDTLSAELDNLLESSRQARRELKEESKEEKQTSTNKETSSNKETSNNTETSNNEKTSSDGKQKSDIS